MFAKSEALHRTIFAVQLKLQQHGLMLDQQRQAQRTTPAGKATGAPEVDEVINKVTGASADVAHLVTPTDSSNEEVSIASTHLSSETLEAATTCLGMVINLVIQIKCVVFQNLHLYIVFLDSIKHGHR